MAFAEPVLTVGERLDRLRIGAFHWRLFGLIAGGLFVDVYDQTLAGAVLATLVFYVYQGEIFPTAFRQRGVGLGIASGRVILVLSPYLIVPLYGWGGTPAVFSLELGLLAVTIVAILAIGLETRGQSLEAISKGVAVEA